MKNNKKYFEIILDIKPLTERQRRNDAIILNHKFIKQSAQFFRTSLYKVLDNKFDLSTLTEKEILVIKYKRNGKHKIDYNSIKNRYVKAQIKNAIEKSFPIIF